MKTEVKWIAESDSFVINETEYSREEAKDLYDALAFHFEPIFIPSCWVLDDITTENTGSLTSSASTIDFTTTYTTKTKEEA